MVLNIWKWEDGDVEDNSIVIAVCTDAQAAWNELQRLGFTSEVATEAVRFMDGEDYGRPISDSLGDRYRVADAAWIDEKFKRYAAGVSQ